MGSYFDFFFLRPLYIITCNCQKCNEACQLSLSLSLSYIRVTDQQSHFCRPRQREVVRDDRNEKAICRISSWWQPIATSQIRRVNRLILPDCSCLKRNQIKQKKKLVLHIGWIIQLGRLLFHVATFLRLPISLCCDHKNGGEKCEALVYQSAFDLLRLVIDKSHLFIEPDISFIYCTLRFWLQEPITLGSRRIYASTSFSALVSYLLCNTTYLASKENATSQETFFFLILVHYCWSYWCRTNFLRSGPRLQ